MPGPVTAPAGLIRLATRPRLRQGVTSILAVAGALWLVACREPTLRHNAISRPVEIEVHDATTGAAAARGATGTIRSGTYSAELVIASPATDLVLVGLGGPGTCSVTIQNAGYRDWARTNVRAQDDGCGQPTTAVFKANLEATG